MSGLVSRIPVCCRTFVKVHIMRSASMFLQAMDSLVLLHSTVNVVQGA
jgi:hypothetical protein